MRDFWSFERPPMPLKELERALELLAGCHGAGCPEGLMIAHGFTINDMVDLIRGGLASATAQRVRAGRVEMEVAALRITEAGRRVLGARGR
jgi:hypothetical protein